MGNAPQVKPQAKPFRMPVGEVRTIPGRGTTVSGTIQQGSIRKDAPVEIVGGTAGALQSVVTAVVLAGKVVDHASAGHTVELLLRGVPAGQIGRNSVVRAR